MFSIHIYVMDLKGLNVLHIEYRYIERDDEELFLMSNVIPLKVKYRETIKSNGKCEGCGVKITEDMNYGIINLGYDDYRQEIKLCEECDKEARKVLDL